MDEILTRKDASEYLKIPVRTLDHLVATGQIPFSRIGKRSVRFSHERLREWFLDREGIQVRYNKQDPVRN